MELDLNVRPVVLIYLDKRASAEDIQYIFYGLEEEKIPYSLEQRNFSTATEAAYIAANTSSLNVGIGYVNNEVALHYKNLAPETPYQSIQRVVTCPPLILKSFGGNAARLVKGVPFKSIDPMEVKA
ncbi:glycerol dehydratase reactivase beta/small subunit family protein [Enterococcus raffinosus]|uniref:glycerol dehydratase reactivase beta/small subunit family protein n=1 Tax=Enterococcus raffinosus TaxID=71452 RepID=UPI001C10D108|nr:glycerol dehydratase reactivase beta/small subunit family protein [Enterococcus raffinosus]MBU5359700.1 glycerol dehydratase reactivase beta/small subunit family protein [Enterococcus raffinosus]